MNYFLTYSFYVIILSILMGISTWKLFKKMGYSPFTAFIPFYNYYIILKETEHPKWWVVLTYFPVVGLIMMSVFHLFLMRKFGKKSFGEGFLTVVLPFIYMAFVSYNKNTEIPQPDKYSIEEPKKKEGFWGAVVYAIVFATVIHTFITQPFGIPTGSMERTLLVGDFLFVNKLNYGYRFPMRPVALPFLQGTIGGSDNPKKAPKSYIDEVKLPYFRLPGWEKVERYDIVVFNYPQDSVHTATDRKDPYVKRAVGIPGDVVEMRAGKLLINGKPEKILGDEFQQHAFYVEASSELDIRGIFKALGYVSIQSISSSSPNTVMYRMQLWDEAKEYIEQLPQVISVEEEIVDKDIAAIAYKNQAKTRVDTSNSIFPINSGWNPDWYGPIKIPKKGDVVELNSSNLPTYRWIISEYEHHKLRTKDGKIFIDDKETNQYKIQQDYYMMMGDNRDASLDARFFGFVPEENIIGKPMFTWLSVEGLFSDSQSSYQADGKRVRWDRMFKATNTGQKDKASYWWIAVLILVVFFGWEYFAKLFGKKKTEDEE